MIYCLLSICLASVIPTLRQFRFSFTLQTMIGTNFNWQPISQFSFDPLTLCPTRRIVQRTKNIYIDFFFHRIGGDIKEEEITENGIQKVCKLFLYICVFFFVLSLSARLVLCRIGKEIFDKE